MEKNLSEFIDSIKYSLVTLDECSPCTIDLSSVRINGLFFDSRAVKPGSLFFALPGTHTTGNRFIASAIKNGASAVVFEGEITEEEKDAIQKVEGHEKVVFIHVESSRFAMSPMSACFYDYPSKKLCVYGVTGTEGKSSTVAFIWQLLRLAGYKAGFISTVEYSLGGEAVANPEHQTTPEATIVQRELYEMVCNGCTHAVVESSSHGLSPRTNRLGDVLFDCGAFMNVTLEHLEFHGTYEQYRDDKANLFRALDKHDHVKVIDGKELKITPAAVANCEDKAYGFFAGCTKVPVTPFTIKDADVVSTKNDISFLMKTASGEEIRVHAPVPGAFNAYNIMAAIHCVSLTTGKSPRELASLCASLKTVKGRMTVVDRGQDFEVIVDYAHTPSSFETIFPPIRNRCSGKMICVFGSGGERDVTKRPLQGAIAARFCDIVILANEDPRGEDEMALLMDIAKGSLEQGKVEGKDLFLIPDRPTAIRKAFALAGKNDIVLLLGKSHENSIIFKDHVMPYDEIQTAQDLLDELVKDGIK